MPLPGEFLPQLLRVIGKGRQDVLTPPGWSQWRMTYHPITSVWSTIWLAVDATLEVVGSKWRYALKGGGPL